MRTAWAGDARGFEALLDREPELVTARSSCSHPTLLQFVVLDGAAGRIPEPTRFIEALVERGARLDEPLLAAASVGARAFAALLLEAGAPIEACAPWTPLEESIYWAHRDLTPYLLERGASVGSLRAAAGLDDLERVGAYLTPRGPAPEAGPVRFPWGTPSEDPQDVLDQALVIAAKNGAGRAIERLVEVGADPNAFPPGIHQGGGALHHAAMQGRAETVELLLGLGADASLADRQHGATPAGWAVHGGHADLSKRLSS